MSKILPSLKVNQWSAKWDDIDFDEKQFRKKPKGHIYMFSISAKDLLRLSGINRRRSGEAIQGASDIGIQRRLDDERSAEINSYVNYGYPISGLSLSKLKKEDIKELKKPGWLPTAIIINILESGEKRYGREIAESDLVKIVDKDTQFAEVILPKDFTPEWTAQSLHPFEVIDGQHRLSSFAYDDKNDSFQLPVVAFHGLDISWQAYLFYTINIRPKRINASLAFDLYPLLRTEEWLTKFDGPGVYKEARAQEIVDILFSHPSSPWYERINMLGESGLGKEMLTQAAWIRSLLATFIKSWEGKRVSIGGLFGSKLGSHDQVIPWSREEQAALIIYIGSTFMEIVMTSKEEWTSALRKNSEIEGDDPALWGKYSLINQDQGIRALLNITNDFLFTNSDQLDLYSIKPEVIGNNSRSLDDAVDVFRQSSISTIMIPLLETLSTFDWRSSSAPGLTAQDSTFRAAFRGSGGYKELRRALLIHLSKSQHKIVAVTSEKIIEALSY